MNNVTKAQRIKRKNIILIKPKAKVVGLAACVHYI